MFCRRIYFPSNAQKGPEAEQAAGHQPCSAEAGEGRPNNVQTAGRLTVADARSVLPDAEQDRDGDERGRDRAYGVGAAKSGSGKEACDPPEAAASCAGPDAKAAHEQERADDGASQVNNEFRYKNS